MNIFDKFCVQATEEERQSFFFQQDGATCHTSHVSLQRVHEDFSEERTVGKNLCPPRSPDLNNLRLFSLGTLEDHGVRNKSARNTGTEGHQPRSCRHRSHYFTPGVPKHD
jgi:hypothetical protein